MQYIFRNLGAECSVMCQNGGAQRFEFLAACRLHALHPTPNIIWMIQSRMGGVGHVAHMDDTRNECRFLVGRIEIERPLGEYIY